jgi:hypothetical protein
MVSQKTLEALEGSDPPVGYIIRVRMRRQKEVNLSVLGIRTQRGRDFQSVQRRHVGGPGPKTRFQTRVALKRSGPANAKQADAANAVIPKSEITSLEKVWELLF